MTVSFHSRLKTSKRYYYVNNYMEKKVARWRLSRFKCRPFLHGIFNLQTIKIYMTINYNFKLKTSKGYCEGKTRIGKVIIIIIHGSVN